MAYLQEQMKSGTDMTTAQLLEAWSKEKKEDMVVSVSDGSSTSSPLTEWSEITPVSALVALAYRAAVPHISHFVNKLINRRTMASPRSILPNLRQSPPKQRQHSLRASGQLRPPGTVWRPLPKKTSHPRPNQFLKLHQRLPLIRPS